MVTFVPPSLFSALIEEKNFFFTFLETRLSGSLCTLLEYAWCAVLSANSDAVLRVTLYWYVGLPLALLSLVVFDLAINFPSTPRLYFLFFFNLPRNPGFLPIFGSVMAGTGTAAKGNDITAVVVEPTKGTAGSNGVTGNGTFGMAARGRSEFNDVVVAAKPTADGVAWRRGGFGVQCEAWFFHSA